MHFHILGVTQKETKSSLVLLFSGCVAFILTQQHSVKFSCI